MLWVGTAPTFFTLKGCCITSLPPKLTCMWLLYSRYLHLSNDHAHFFEKFLVRVFFDMTVRT